MTALGLSAPAPARAFSHDAAAVCADRVRERLEACASASSSTAKADPRSADGRSSVARRGVLGGLMKSIVLIFEDQLSLENPVFRSANPRRDVVVLVDSAGDREEMLCRKLFRVRGMDAFAALLRRRGWRVEVVAVDPRDSSDALSREVRLLANRSDVAQFVAAEPGDVALRAALDGLAGRFRKPVSVLDDPRFILTRGEFDDVRAEAGSAAGFYRLVRRRISLLMDGDEPEGGRWRFDEGASPAAPRPVAKRKEFDRPEPTASQAEEDLERFISALLPDLGPCDDLDPVEPHRFPCADIDAMLDAGMLTPLTVCRRIEAAFREGRVPLHAAEHAIYRLVGLREYRRGLLRLGEVWPAGAASRCV